MFKNLIIFLVVGQVFGISFAPGTKEEDGKGKDTDKNENKVKVPVEEILDGELVRELSDAELRKIVAEQPLDDPLNAFYDPFEPYRLSTFAYWHPITFPKEHANPPLPAGFLPPNAPPKSFPSDFFFQDDEARRIVLGEHAAAFCPYLRRWREKHPLQPYPVDADFLQNHPPIKFIPGQGYEIDMELARLNYLTRKAQEQILKKAAEDAQQSESIMNSAATIAITSVADDSTKTDSKSQNSTDKNKKSEDFKSKEKKKKSIWELSVLLDVISKVKKSRPDCKSSSKFLEAPKRFDPYLASPPSCLQEVIFFMDELEDIYDPVDPDDLIPETVNKDEYYRQFLIKLEASKRAAGKKGGGGGGKKDGKCPFGFKSEKTEQQKPRTFQGTIPKWAELKKGEKRFSYSDDERAGERIVKCRFAYKQVPFPSIQDTLKKYVSI